MKLIDLRIELDGELTFRSPVFGKFPRPSIASQLR
jgi:hypothetical protein